MPELRNYSAGDEIDSWCTKCGLMLNHRIVAMKAGAPTSVICMTCNKTHQYRARPPGEKVVKGVTTRSAGGASPRPSRASAAAEKAMLTERERELTWQKAIAGKGVSDFRGYRTTEKFVEGELLRHVKFGDGVVLRLVDDNKIEVLFQNDSKILAHGLG